MLKVNKIAHLSTVSKHFCHFCVIMIARVAQIESQGQSISLDPYTPVILNIPTLSVMC